MTNWEELYKGKDKHLLDWRMVAPFELPEEHFTSLKKWCTEAKTRGESLTNRLVGHIKQEYKINNFSEKFENYILNCSAQPPVFQTWQNLSVNSEDKPIYLEKLWVNYQKKHEFNPLHDHSGVFSFIIFINIPYDLKEEDKYFSGLNCEDREQQIHTSRLAFVNNRANGGLESTLINVDKSFEGKMFMFPARQAHIVYPFYTSDGYRITVSGNMKLKV